MVCLIPQLACSLTAQFTLFPKTVSHFWPTNSYFGANKKGGREEVGNGDKGKKT